jgi:hypothetical protein
MPRDRESTFEPRLIPEHQRRLSGFNELVISLVARAMSTRDTQARLAEIYGVDVSPELISKVTDHPLVCPLQRMASGRSSGAFLAIPLGGVRRSFRAGSIQELT